MIKRMLSGKTHFGKDPQQAMKKYNVLDVTLRDGGCVLDFRFGRENMERILAAQEEAGIDLIELGYIDEENGSAAGRTMYCSEQVIPEALLHQKKPGITYVAMIDCGRYDTSRLQPRTEGGIDGIRLAFHKKDRQSMMRMGQEILEKGYRLFLQPMVIMRYSDREFLELIDLVNRELADAAAFYIVDSFGEMRPMDVIRRLSLLDENLAWHMPMGLHTHNNMQLSFSNALTLLQYRTHRSIILDSSIRGMGKGAGNLNTELLLECLNRSYGGRYAIQPLLELIDQVINRLQKEHPWGYAPEYYLSSKYRCSPTYAGFFYREMRLSIEETEKLLAMIEEDKRSSFDRTYAAGLAAMSDADETGPDGRCR